MKVKWRKLLSLPLVIFIAYVFAGCEQAQDILKPPVKLPELSVSPNNGRFIPAGLDVNGQALLVAQQSLSTGEGTEYFSKLDALNSLLERLGEGKPPGRGIPAAPPRMPITGKLSAQRAIELSRLSPVTIIGNINQTVDGITFTGKSSTNKENLVTAQLQGVSTDGTNIDINQKYSNNPDDFTYHIDVSGTLVKDGFKMSYKITTDYDSDGNGGSAFGFKVLNGTDKTAYDMQLVLSDNGRALLCAEAVTRADGFWGSVIDLWI